MRTLILDFQSLAIKIQYFMIFKLKNKFHIFNIFTNLANI